VDEMAGAKTTDLSIFELADRLAYLKGHKSELEARVKNVNGEIESTIEQLASAMLDEELANFRRNGQTFFLQQQIFVSAISEQKENLFGYLDDVAPGMVTRTVNANTLRAWTKEQMAGNDGDLPAALEGFVRITEKPSVGMRKAK